MNRIAVIDVVALSSSIIGEHTPFIKKYSEAKSFKKIKPILPALTTSAQSSYLTGSTPSEHGVVGNGWYDHRDAEIKFWKQSGKLVEKESIWTSAKKIDPNFTCAQMFWWYNMYNEADYSVTPRPNYLADGRKVPDCYAYPSSLRDELTEKFGKFPLFNFWGPNANIKSSKWIANAAMYVEEKHQPTLNLIYLPHLDYCLQKFGPDIPAIASELEAIDKLVESLVLFFEGRGVEVVLLSEYGISPVSNPIHINRILRNKGLLDIRHERGLELLDAGASDAFAVSDHQIAHIYTKNDEIKERVKLLLKDVKGINHILDKSDQQAHGIDHERSGDLVLLSDQDSWFTYYFWLNDEVAPDYARMVDIHKKPGYDPVEMFMSSKSRAIFKLLLKKAGLRANLDITPLDANLVKGSHGITEVEEQYYPVYIGQSVTDETCLKATQLKQILLNKIFAK